MFVSTFDSGLVGLKTSASIAAHNQVRWISSTDLMITL